MKHLSLSTKLILLSIWLFAATFRFYNLNWDQGFHLHPDERAIVMKVMEMKYPSSLSSFFSVDSPWNPHFFAYGSLPLYLLKIAGDGMGIFDKLFAGYDLITITGRYMSAMFDLMTLVLVFLLGKRLWGTMTGFLASFFYAISVLPIQLSHFYAVDTLLTCFTLAVLYHLIRFYEKPSVRRSLLIGLFFGLALATKISAVVLIVPIGAALVIDFSLLFLSQPHKPRNWLPHIPAFLRHLLSYALLIFLSTIVTFLVCEPYAVIDFKEFWLHTTQQSIMTHNAFIFPYTLQYVWKIPYIYELKNIFLWGLGPLLGTVAIIGAVYVTCCAFYKEISVQRRKEIILVTFFWMYFCIVGRFAVGFMRYMLPLYPLLTLFAGVLITRCLVDIRRPYKALILLYCGILFLIWPLSFLRIYTNPNTRFTASQWITEHIPAGKTIAVEHWDDALPLVGGQNYRVVTLPLYEPDTDEKWAKIESDLRQTDYIIIASNRLYAPLQRLTDCTRLPRERCYPRTAEYYQKLFANRFAFHKVADFRNYPKVPFFDIPINDQSADESFTVYDHPRVMIFHRK